MLGLGSTLLLKVQQRLKTVLKTVLQPDSFEKRGDCSLIGLAEFQHKSQEIFLESKRAMLKVCSMIARRSTLQFSDTTSGFRRKRRIRVTRHNFSACVVKALIFSTFWLQSCQDENVARFKLVRTTQGL